MTKKPEIFLAHILEGIDEDLPRLKIQIVAILAEISKGKLIK